MANSKRASILVKRDTASSFDIRCKYFDLRSSFLSQSETESRIMIVYSFRYALYSCFLIFPCILCTDRLCTLIFHDPVQARNNF